MIASNRRASAPEPTPEQLNDFSQKCGIAIAVVAARPEFRGTDDAHARSLNLMMGAKPRTKAERALRDALLAQLAELFPGAAYPPLAAPAPCGPKAEGLR